MVKYWAKPDKLYLNEVNAEEAEVDDFKKGRVIKLDKGVDKEKTWEKPNSKPLPDNTNYMREEVGVQKRRST